MLFRFWRVTKMEAFGGQLRKLSMQVGYVAMGSHLVSETDLSRLSPRNLLTGRQSLFQPDHELEPSRDEKIKLFQPSLRGTFAALR